MQDQNRCNFEQKNFLLYVWSEYLEEIMLKQVSFSQNS